MADSPLIRLDSHGANHPFAPMTWTMPPTRPVMVLRCDAPARIELRDHQGIVRRWSDPEIALQWMVDSLADLPDPDARWVGYLSYDFGRRFERIPSRAPNDLGFPLFHFALCTRAPMRPLAPDSSILLAKKPLSSTFSQSDFESAVRRALAYIAAGDIFQVNLSQRFTTGLPRPPADIYERLLLDAPAEYGAYLHFDDHVLLCNSPELFLRVTPLSDGHCDIITRPIKGTRPRLPGMDRQLLESAKDQAELNMIIDLERNDLGRICEIGSVRVAQDRHIETHPTVFHGVATIAGTLRKSITLYQILRATFPGGSITGAPKIRAMQIIDELEPVQRGPYCGAIGSIAASGVIEFNIAIRTMLIKDGLVHIPVGGGIVADSEPTAEYQETLVKAKAMFAALGITPPLSP